jgi:hypothetical protein
MHHARERQPIKVHIFGNRKGSTNRHAHPIRTHRHALLDFGIETEFFYSFTDFRLKECDVLLFMEANFGELLRPGQDHTEALAPFLSSFKHVVWFDDHDSSGMLRTYVFPLVDVYAKSQLLKERTYYNEEHLTGVLHRDHVHELYGMPDQKVFKGAVGYGLSKLWLGWNFALLDWQTWLSGVLIRKLRFYFPSRTNRVSTTVPRLKERPIHMAYRVGMWANSPTIHWWRQRTLEELQAFSANHSQFCFRLGGKLSTYDYFHEMRQTVVTPSPFGMGEICYRDFETFLCGSLLLKPRMDHLETWPNLFVEGETYIAHEWDYSDFQDKLHSILVNPAKYEPIAREGQRRFMDSLENGEAFARHFVRMLQLRP